MRAAMLALVLVAMPAVGAEVAGVRFDEAIQIGPERLVLNGAGLRRRFIFRVYAMGLYLPEKRAEAQAVLAAPGPKRIAIRMLRNVDAETFIDALEEGVRANQSVAEAKALEPRVRRLAATLRELKQAKEGMAIALDWRPQAGTVLVVDGRARGEPIAGEDFYRALLRIWLGPHPVQESLKKELLGR